MSSMKTRRFPVVPLAAASLVAGTLLGVSFTVAESNSKSNSAGVQGVGAPAPAAPPSQTPTDPNVTLKKGKALAVPAVSELTTPVALGNVRTVDGAAAAFTSYATWLVASPAAAAKPKAAIDVVASKSLSPADREMLQGMARDKDLSFDPLSGAYRVIGQSGEDADLKAVMLEVLAPITYGVKTRWLVVGGVVSWRDDSWKVDSMIPREIKQPASGAKRLNAIEAAEESLEVSEVGWQSFANAES